MTPIEQLEVPPTVQALLAARIDRLGELEKSVLQAAAVIGKEFSEPILKSVLPGQDLAVALRQLKDSEFIYEQSLYPVAEYAFKHPLTQEVALHSQLQERRKRTHALAADALEAAHADHLDESAALLAHHHEEAGSAATAARWHRRAAEWAGLNDIAAALRHWQRVRELARQGDDPESIALTIAACARALAIGGWRVGASAAEWAELFDEGSAAAERAGDLHELAALNATHGAARAISEAVAPDYARYAGEAVRIADRTGDAALRCGTRAPLSFGHTTPRSAAGRAHPCHSGTCTAADCGKRSRSPTRSSNWRVRTLTWGPTWRATAHCWAWA
jgi:adenylate cyclase